jgi:hypothetical protein
MDDQEIAETLNAFVADHLTVAEFKLFSTMESDTTSGNHISISHRRYPLRGGGEKEELEIRIYERNSANILTRLVIDL